MQSKYKNTGWFRESERHSLARKGVRTGRKTDYAKDFAFGGVTYSPTSISTKLPPELSEKRVMGDVDNIIAETAPFESEIAETEYQVGEKRISPKDFERDDIDEELEELEDDFPDELPKEKGYKALKGKIIEVLKGAYQALGDKNKAGIASHLKRLEEHKAPLQERIQILQSLKKKIMSEAYREKHGVSRQLEQLDRINKIISSPKGELSKIDSHIDELTSRMARIEEKEITGGVGSGEKKSGGGILGGIFPSFDEIIHPEKLRSSGGSTRIKENDIPTVNEVRQKQVYKSGATMLLPTREEREKYSIFPSWDEILHPEKLRK
jgi:hypothetical protein